MKRRLITVLALVALVLAIAGTAVAVSDGDYDYEKQHCTGNANNSDQEKQTEEGCHTATGTVSDGRGREYGGVGVQQQPDGSNPSFDDVTVWGPGEGAYHPVGGAHLYFGADDNLDNGEHDSSEQVDNGPSDGGGIQLNVTPESVAKWVAALQARDRGYLLTHPLPLVDAGFGACADGLCFSVQTQRRVAFQGGDKKKHRDVSNYEGKQWDPESCSGPDDKAKDCGGKPLKSWDDKEGTTYVEPGVQVYEDPDAQASPIGPYPLPAAYAGTCGVIAGGGKAPVAPASPVTNKAGQVVVATGC